MKTFKKCELCDLELSGERCAFAIHKRVVSGKEHYFCCEHHADEFEKRHRERE